MKSLSTIVLSSRKLLPNRMLLEIIATWKISEWGPVPIGFGGASCLALT